MTRSCLGFAQQWCSKQDEEYTRVVICTLTVYMFPLLWLVFVLAHDPSDQDFT